MYIFSTLFLLFSTSSLITAAPNIKPLPSPIPSSSPSPAAGLGIQNPSPSPSPTPAKQCPANSKKQCCITVQDSTEELTSNLGEVIPFLSGVKIGSVIGMGCQDMPADHPDDTCRDTIACCSGAEFLGPHTITGGCYPLSS